MYDRSSERANESRLCFFIPSLRGRERKREKERESESEKEREKERERESDPFLDDRAYDEDIFSQRIVKRIEKKEPLLLTFSW